MKDKVLITSNRDEQTLREPATLPEAVELPSGKILFPKDGRAGGTWVALHNNGNVMVLLNGAFKKHHHNPPYRKSRGLIFLDIFDTPSPKASFETINLLGIEPFTLVIWENGTLTETRWDGQEKYITPIPSNIPRIWSSATLYDDEVIAMRKEWFAKWLNEPTFKNADSIKQFHEFAGNGDESISLKMNRDGLLQTVSITCIELTPNKAAMYYKDITGGLVSINEWYIKKQLLNS